jgi:acetylornithine deacetylase
VPQFRRTRLDTPLHLLFSFDEEVGCIGVRRALKVISDLPIRPRGCIIGEPTSMQVANAQKGCAFFRTTISGRDGHSSAPGRGVNAIEAAARIIAEIGRVGAEAARRGGGDRFDPPHTTLNVGVIEGGAAVNIIARDCRFEWDLRAVPGDDPLEMKAGIDAFIAAELLPRMRAVFPDAAVATETIVSVPPLLPDPGSPAEALARRLTGANTATTVSFASEAGLYQQAGIPAIICGPGSIDVAHQPNEFITREELAAGRDFLDRLLAWARTGGG